MQTQTANFKQKILFTKLFTQSEELTLKHIKLILQRMFEHADDTLFALAEKTNSTKESTAYFDSMRIIRLKRNDIENQHFEYIQQAFTEVNKGDIPPQDEVSSLDSLTMDDLSIIEDADLEENIAIKNIVSKVTGQCGPDLSAIEKTF